VEVSVVGINHLARLPSPTQSNGATAEEAMNVVAIAVFEGVEELDFVGPWEVLSGWRLLYPEDVDVHLVGDDTGPVTCAHGLRVLPERTWEDLGNIDVLVYPGGRGTRAQLGDVRIRSRLRALSASGTLMASVCTGALVFADSGLLDGLPAATYWNAFDELLSLGRDIQPRPNDRFVDNGAIITSAGVSAGIDMALHLVGRLGSPERAGEVRRYIQYDPEPPYPSSDLIRK
jgi:transcriptional regulator GlxA family with amidase domain